MSASPRFVPEGHFHFTTLYLEPGFDESCIGGRDVIVRRTSQRPSMFDIATLSVKHEVELPYTLMEVFTSRSQAEVSVAADSFEEAWEKVSAFRLLLYSEGGAPFVIPLCSNALLAEMAGINARDSEYQRAHLPPEKRGGITSATHLIGVSGLELLLATHSVDGLLPVRREQVERAISRLEMWKALCKREPALQFFQGVITSAPQLPSTSQAILHLWTGIEGLFPDVQSEVTFRVALNVACLEPDPSKRRTTFDAVKKAYRTRSRIAHGAHRGIDEKDWREAWTLTMSILRSILVRQRLPSESELMDQVLGGGLGEPA